MRAAARGALILGFVWVVGVIGVVRFWKETSAHWVINLGKIEVTNIVVIPHAAIGYRSEEINVPSPRSRFNVDGFGPESLVAMKPSFFLSSGTTEHFTPFSRLPHANWFSSDSVCGKRNVIGNPSLLQYTSRSLSKILALLCPLLRISIVPMTQSPGLKKALPFF